MGRKEVHRKGKKTGKNGLDCFIELLVLRCVDLYGMVWCSGKRFSGVAQRQSGGS